MSKTYDQILKQIESLKTEAAKVRRQEVDGVISRIRDAISQYGLTAADLGLGSGKRTARQPAKPAPAKKRKKFVVAVKYRDDAGHTWTGRGLKPIWLRDAIAAGKSRDDFDVAKR